ncbi:hypothetical protein HGRIS_002217 [Hohenbuehelia grisea]|uniref:Uncharacterized protein n=1 Tax=Hohenbuehelia grisea TaxID=104357 RepID=A0ABR3JJU5_9AGAR
MLSLPLTLVSLLLPLPYFLAPFSLTLPGALLVRAGTANKDDACSVQNSRLQVGTYQFWSDCNSVTFCNATTNKCQLRGCRSDDFPFGYKPTDSHLPPKCQRGEFCPDEEDACQPLLPPDSACQLNRDDECEAPPNFKELADESGRGLNFNGSVCIKNVCMWANKTAGDDCVSENTPYTVYGRDGEFIDIVSRGNCRLGLYCDTQSLKCLAEKAIGAACTADKECSTWNCMTSGVCGISASTPRHLGIWVYVVVALGIFGGMFGTLIGLFIMHRRQRDVEREKRVQYWREQHAFHQNLTQMREAARASILALPQNGSSSARSTLYGRDGALSDESQAPILQHAATKASGLRHYMSDDNSSEYDDGLGMQNRKVGNRF